MFLFTAVDDSIGSSDRIAGVNLCFREEVCLGFCHISGACAVGGVVRGRCSYVLRCEGRLFVQMKAVTHLSDL